jgi:hypothetical protein
VTAAEIIFDLFLFPLYINHAFGLYLFVNQEPENKALTGERKFKRELLFTVSGKPVYSSGSIRARYSLSPNERTTLMGAVGNERPHVSRDLQASSIDSLDSPTRARRCASATAQVGEQCEWRAAGTVVGIAAAAI